jgi:DMSO/TMAO reductase YedYZ molybdopterin-dependent catalytic subunit/thiosulfate reductase cytochrome b subunit
LTGLDFPLWLRAIHYLNIVFLSLIIRSGIEILSAHPKLYWKDDAMPGSEWIRFTKKKLPKDELWTSRDEEESFSSWIAMPGHQNLGLGRHWHFLTDALWVLSGLIYVILLFVTNEWRRLIPTTWAVFPEAWHDLLLYFTGHIVLDPKYNALQMLTYSSVVFILAPLAILTGLAMSPAIAGRFPWYIRIFGGRQSARSLHFIILLAFILFTIIHTIMVFLHGFSRELGAIVLGETQNPNLTLAIVVGLGGLAILFVAHILATQYSLANPRKVKNWMDVSLNLLRRLLFHHQVSMQEYSPSEISPYFRVNGRPPKDADYDALARDNFAGFILEVGGLVENPLHLTLADLRIMPKTTQITKHDCIQGWSAVGQWGGVQFTHIIELCRPRPEVQYVVFYAFDNKSSSEPYPAGPGFFYGTIDMELARHRQTILAYEFNGQPLPIPHGAPLRLRVETQLGFKMVKYIRAIEFVAEYHSIGEGQGGWREDHQNYSTEAGI